MEIRLYLQTLELGNICSHTGKKGTRAKRNHKHFTTFSKGILNAQNLLKEAKLN